MRAGGCLTLIIIALIGVAVGYYVVPIVMGMLALKKFASAIKEG